MDPETTITVIRDSLMSLEGPSFNRDTLPCNRCCEK